MSGSWNKNELGVVDTIYEEEYDEQEHPHSSSDSGSSSSPPPSPPLHSKVQSWSLATGRKPDVLIYVMGTCFHLHKEPLTSRSTYLKRQLAELSAITLPLNITAETFTLVAEFCYGTDVALSPFNVAALRTASELLGMTEADGGGGHDENLRQITEAYFCRVVAVDRVLVVIVFRSCLRLLPESETTAFLVSRCIEALSLTGDDEDDLGGCFEDVITLNVEEFQIVAESMRCRFSSHDILYMIVDLYTKEHDEKITEEEKNEICEFIDCDKLSSQFLIHAVQNPRLPLRFIVRAMLIEQLNTRRAFITATADHHRTHSALNGSSSITLGSILRREAAAREAASIKSEMDATSSRIQSLESELAGMKRLLIKSEKDKIAMEKKLIVMQKPKQILVESDEKKERSVIGSGRSASFHYGLKEIGNKIGRGEKGSSSFAGIRVRFGEEKMGAGSLISSDDSTPRSGKKVINGGIGLIRRLKNTIWVSKSSASSPKLSRKQNRDGDDDGSSVGSREDGKENIVIMTTKNDVASSNHKRNRSVG